MKVFKVHKELFGISLAVLDRNILASVIQNALIHHTIERIRSQLLMGIF